MIIMRDSTCLVCRLLLRFIPPRMLDLNNWSKRFQAVDCANDSMKSVDDVKFSRPQPNVRETCVLWVEVHSETTAVWLSCMTDSCRTIPSGLPFSVFL